ncbi:MAG: hypothetical protein ABI239_13445 [Aquihabitans sp.]
MSDTSRHPVRHPLTSLAEAAHLSAGHSGAGVICVDLGLTEVAIGHWLVPQGVDHPVEALIGVVAPDQWDAVGLTVDSHRRDLTTGHRTSAQTTVLVDRSGACAAVIDDGRSVPRTITKPPVGVMPDALLRVLGLPTPEPPVPIGYLVESAWLDAIAALVLGQPGEIRSWATVANLHPLAAPEQPGEPGVCLSVAVQALQQESSWARLLHLWASNATASRHRPPDMEAVPLETWFDEGSFARWTLRLLPVAEDLLPAVLDAVPDAIGGELIDALVTVGDGVAPDLA